MLPGPSIHPVLLMVTRRRNVLGAVHLDRTEQRGERVAPGEARRHFDTADDFRTMGCNNCRPRLLIGSNAIATVVVVTNVTRRHLVGGEHVLGRNDGRALGRVEDDILAAGRGRSSGTAR